jgi:putative transcriptional regulator
MDGVAFQSDVPEYPIFTLSVQQRPVDITLANLSILKTGKARAIRFSTLEAICKTLDCQPGDILVLDRDSED